MSTEKMHVQIAIAESLMRHLRTIKQDATQAARGFKDDVAAGGVASQLNAFKVAAAKQFRSMMQA